MASSPQTSLHAIRDFQRFRFRPPTTDERGALFVTNVLNGTVAADDKVVKQVTVIRINLTLSNCPFSHESTTLIGSGFSERTDPAALVTGAYGHWSQERRFFPIRGGRVEQPDQWEKRGQPMAMAGPEAPA